MKKIISLVLLVSMLLVNLVVPASAVGAPAANQWQNAYWSPTIMSATDNADASTHIAFTPAIQDLRMNTMTPQKLDGLYINLTDINYDGGAIGLPIMLTTVPAGWADCSGMLLISASVSAIYYKGLAGTVSKTISQNIMYTINSASKGLYMYFHKLADGSFKYIINGSKSAEFIMTPNEVLSMFGSADPSIYVSISGGWYPTAGKNTSLNVRDLSSYASNKFLPTDYSVSATDNIAEGSTTLSFTPADPNVNIITYTKTSQKLDGLYMSLTDINYDAGAIGLPIMLTADQGGWKDGPGMNLVSLAGAQIYYRGAGGAVTKSITGVQYIPNHARQGLNMYVYKLADGSFKYIINGYRNADFTMTSAEVISMFGSADPSVYVSIGGGWFPAAGKNTSLKVSELSSGNSNRLLSYYDPFGRDALVLANGDMSGITYTHNGNEGAYVASAKTMKLDGLSFEYTQLNEIDVPGYLFFKFDTVPGLVLPYMSATKGIVFYLSPFGSVGKFSNGIDSDYLSPDSSAVFNNGISDARPSQITVSANKLTNGDYKFTFTGNFETGTNELSYTVTASEMTTQFGSTNPDVYLNMSSTQSQTVHIASVERKMNYGTYNNMNGILTNVTPGTTVLDFNTLVTPVADSVTFTKFDGTLISSGKIGTGTTIVIKTNGYASTTKRVVIYGDVTGDGDINVYDLVAVKQHLLKVQTLVGIKLSAGAITNKSTVKISDLLSIKKQMLGLATISQQ